MTMTRIARLDGVNLLMQDAVQPNGIVALADTTTVRPFSRFRRGQFENVTSGSASTSPYELGLLDAGRRALAAQRNTKLAALVNDIRRDLGDDAPNDDTLRAMAECEMLKVERRARYLAEHGED